MHVPYHLCMRVLGIIIVICHLNLQKSCLSLWRLYILFVLSLRWPYTTICFVTSATLYKSLFGNFGDQPQEFVLNSPEVNYRASYQSRSTGPIIGLSLQGQLSVQTYSVIYRSRPTGPVSVQIYRASYRYRSSGPVIGPRLQGQLPVHSC